MIQIMYDAPGVGLAAPQMGINKNIFVFDAGDGPKVAINPKLKICRKCCVYGRLFIFTGITGILKDMNMRNFHV